MEERYLIGLTAILVLGVAARWLAWRLHLPAILLLLICGIVAGPVTNFLEPDDLFGNFLNPFVSLSVGLILFEGAMSLNLRELKEIGGVVRNLITIGVAVTWAIGSVSAWAILGLDYRLALLLGAVFVVTGPTVVIPLLRYVRPTPRIRNAIKWEGILIDPVGAILAVLVFEAILATGGSGAREGAMQFLYSVLTGAGVGIAVAVFTVILLYFRWLPDFLDAGFTLGVVLGAFTLSNHFRAESGLLATTVMGIVLANQRFTPVRHIVEFKEHLRILIISTLFIVLSARLQAADIYAVWKPALAFLAVLVFIARPASVWLSCLGSKLSTNERRFLMWMAPRGIVAAAISSLFSEHLADEGIAGADILAPIAFIVIIGTVTIYGLTALPVANRLGLAEPSPQGVLFVGAHSWARRIALELKKVGFRVALADSRWKLVADARLEGLSAYYGAMLSEGVLDEINLYGIGRLAAVTSNDEANALAALHFHDDFGRSNVYQLAPERSGSGRRGVAPEHLQGRHLFQHDLTYAKLSKVFEEGAVIKTTPITEKFNYKRYKEIYGDNTIPLFLISKDREHLTVAAAAQPFTPKPGQTLISIVPGDAAREVEANRAAEDAIERA